jgi:hypothetical protein
VPSSVCGRWRSGAVRARLAPILWSAAGKKRMGGPSLQRFLYALPRAVGGGGASALEVRDRCRERALERLGAGNLRGAVSAALESLAAIETANADALELGAGETLPGALPWCRIGRRRLSLFSSRSSLSLRCAVLFVIVFLRCAAVLSVRCVWCAAHGDEESSPHNAARRRRAGPGRPGRPD